MTVPTLARHATVATPPGPFTVVVTTDADGRDVVLASGWTADLGDLLPVIHPTLRPVGSERVDDLPVLDVVEKFFAGDVTAIDDVAVRQRSGPFLTEAWEVLRTVPAGHPGQLRLVRRPVRPAGRRPGRRERLRPQRRRAVRALPPGARFRRRTGRVPLGDAGQALAARPRGRARPVAA